MVFAYVYITRLMEQTTESKHMNIFLHIYIYINIVIIKEVELVTGREKCSVQYQILEWLAIYMKYTKINF